MKRKRNVIKFISFICMLALLCIPADIYVRAAEKAETTGTESVREQYEEYRARLERIETFHDIPANGFAVVEDQIFPIDLDGYEPESVSIVPAYDETYSRLALFLVEDGGKVLYKTDQLETNMQVLGQLEQPNRGIIAGAFLDLNGDGARDIVLITTCSSTDDSGADVSYRVGDVLFQTGGELSFYRDYRISDKVNRFGMNMSIHSIAAFVRDGSSTEFMYTAATLDELLSHGLQIIEEQCYVRVFGKLGRLQVVPGTYRIADYEIFMIYLVNEEGYIVSSLQPMGDYDNLYALRGINCSDIDGDGLKDMVVLARYSYENESGEMVVQSDYSVYYQRTGGFSTDKDIKGFYRCEETDTMEALIKKVREYWGWKVDND